MSFIRFARITFYLRSVQRGERWVSSDCEMQYVCSTKCRGYVYGPHGRTLRMVPYIAERRTGGCRSGYACRLLNDDYTCVPGKYPTIEGSREGILLRGQKPAIVPIQARQKPSTGVQTKFIFGGLSWSFSTTPLSRHRANAS